MAVELAHEKVASAGFGGRRNSDDRLLRHGLFLANP